MLCLPRSSSFRLSFLIFVRLSLYFCFSLYLPGTVCAVSLSRYCFLIGLLRSKPPLLVPLWFFYFSRTFLFFSSFFVSSSRELSEYFITFFFGHFLAVRRFPFTGICILNIFSATHRKFRCLTKNFKYKYLISLRCYFWSYRCFKRMLHLEKCFFKFWSWYCGSLLR